MDRSTALIKVKKATELMGRRLFCTTHDLRTGVTRENGVDIPNICLVSKYQILLLSKKKNVRSRSPKATLPALS
jgi:hypothetical protein